MESREEMMMDTFGGPPTEGEIKFGLWVVIVVALGLAVIFVWGFLA